MSYTYNDLVQYMSFLKKTFGKEIFDRLFEKAIKLNEQIRNITNKYFCSICNKELKVHNSYYSLRHAFAHSIIYLDEFYTDLKIQTFM